jgi:hypothetical protein
MSKNKHIAREDVFKDIHKMEQKEAVLETYSIPKITALFDSMRPNSTALETKLVYLKLVTKENVKKRFSEEMIKKVQNLIPNDIILDWDMAEMTTNNKIILSHYLEVEKWMDSFAETHEVFDSSTGSRFELNNSPKSLFDKEIVESKQYQTHLDHLFYFERHKIDKYLTRKDSCSYTIDVDFQREFVWTLEQKQSLILSLMKGLPIGPFYINRAYKNQEIDMILYDGKQRFDAIKGFSNGEFPIVVDGKSYYWYELPVMDIQKLSNSLIDVIETRIEDYNALIEYYITINTGGRTHTEGDIEKAKSLLRK